MTSRRPKRCANATHYSLDRVEVWIPYQGFREFWRCPLCDARFTAQELSERDGVPVENIVGGPFYLTPWERRQPEDRISRLCSVPKDGTP